ncbi:hypothetical protein GGF46_002820 [Coemansia sp. RSA 552]|nr:hypothetical protein GGF46_002820 [Coemansia sp. RSA 552]
MIVQRNPIVTQLASEHETATDQYFEWLDYMSAERFPRDFLKQGSVMEAKWVDSENERMAQWYFDPANKPEPKTLEGGSAAASGSEGERDVAVQPRETQADREGDVRSLERKLDRTLYLVVKDSGGKWGFPQSKVQGSEVLHEAARRSLKDACGGQMSVWSVGRGPIGHHKEAGGTAFFMKGHILAGQAAPKKPLVTDYKWATREELEGAVPAEYWDSVKDVLSTV